MKKMILKVVTFLVKKKIETATGEMEQISKTKLFMLVEGGLQFVEFVSPFFGNPVVVPPEVHKMLFALAGLSYAERQIKK